MAPRMVVARGWEERGEDVLEPEVLAAQNRSRSLAHFQLVSFTGPCAPEAPPGQRAPREADDNRPSWKQTSGLGLESWSCPLGPTATRGPALCPLLLGQNHRERAAPEPSAPEGGLPGSGHHPAPEGAARSEPSSSGSQAGGRPQERPRRFPDPQVRLPGPLPSRWGIALRFIFKSGYHRCKMKNEPLPQQMEPLGVKCNNPGEDPGGGSSRQIKQARAGKLPSAAIRGGGRGGARMDTTDARRHRRAGQVGPCLPLGPGSRLHTSGEV
ncbi:translation initiation factor IF-2-like [Artibeus jamaicensis]|uniref:translation initiation factor IF-2-like n=1 Tax=Artibeus jamaicensis TaxID=9417 RepID=UPI00235B058A|nr:translation initiation factor IF-2-like [Artibeus jamaicensis]